jgi:5,6-dimethylbenzimidazole synthase
MPNGEQNALLVVMNTIVNVRNYQSTPISPEIREELLFAFSLGPSLANTQPWELLILEDLEDRDKVVASTLDPFLTPDSYGGQGWIRTVPLVVIFLVEKRRAMVRLGESGEIFAIQDMFSAIQNARLIAAYYGLSTSCVREFDHQTLHKNLNLPWYLEPVAILTAGYSEEEKEIPPRLSLSDICL